MSKYSYKYSRIWNGGAEFAGPENKGSQKTMTGKLQNLQNDGPHITNKKLSYHRETALQLHMLRPPFDGTVCHVGCEVANT